MGIPISMVDAFTSRPFEGNPAAVCLLDEPRDEGWYQRVAAEMNLSNTAFLYPGEEGYQLRWFTTKIEVELCGHATLATSHILWETGRQPPDAVLRYHTKSGLLLAERKGEWIELNLPATTIRPLESLPGLAESLGASVGFVGACGVYTLCEVESEAIVRGLNPDLNRLLTLPTRAVIVTSRAEAGKEYDFVSRFFAPAAGIPEDPVTGSAHCALGPYWAERLGKTDLLAYQASKRGGLVRVRVDGDRIRIGGQAVTVVRGELSA